MTTYIIKLKCIVTGQIYTMPVLARSRAEAYEKATDQPYASNWLTVITD